MVEYTIRAWYLLQFEDLMLNKTILKKYFAEHPTENLPEFADKGLVKVFGKENFHLYLLQELQLLVLQLIRWIESCALNQTWQTMTEEKLKHYRASTPSVSEEESIKISDKKHEEITRKEAHHHHESKKKKMDKNGEKDGAVSSLTWKISWMEKFVQKGTEIIVPIPMAPPGTTGLGGFEVPSSKGVLRSDASKLNVGVFHLVPSLEVFPILANPKIEWKKNAIWHSVSSSG